MLAEAVNVGKWNGKTGIDDDVTGGCLLDLL